LRTMNKQRTEWIAYLWRRGLLLVVALFMLNSRAHADGGIVALHQVAGPFVVTVFSPPVPLRVGPVDISALVQYRANWQPVLDGEIFIRLRKQGGMTVGGRATREVAQNKLLYSALMNLPEAGRWELEVTIKQGKETASVLGQVSASAPRPFLLSYWRSLSLPPVVIILFALNQWLKLRVPRRDNAELLNRRTEVA
jgi:hypothetical protein